MPRTNHAAKMDCAAAQSITDQINSLLRTPGFQEHLSFCENCRASHLAGTNSPTPDDVRDKVEAAEPDEESRAPRSNSFSCGSNTAFGSSL